MNSIQVILGLSNPMVQYDQTRHNVSTWYIKLLCKKYNLTLKKKK